MRFLEKGCTVTDLVNLFSFLSNEMGIDVHHSSYEYTSYPLYCEVLAKYKKTGATVRHICKLSAPDFKEKKFSKKTLDQKIENELKNLQTDRIEVLQWLYRTEPINDAVRLPQLEEQRHEIDHAFSDYIKSGIVGSVGTFPYSINFAKVVVEQIPSVSGWIDYCNILEQENVQQLPADKWMIGLRPLAAGKVFNSLSVNGNDFDNFVGDSKFNKSDVIMLLSLSYCFGQENVLTNVLSINNLNQAKKISNIVTYLSSKDSGQQVQAFQYLKTEADLK